MGVNKEILNRGIKYMAWALPLIFIGPPMIYNAFINKNNGWHYLVLAIGIGICLGAIYCMFKGIQAIVNSLFENNDD